MNTAPKILDEEPAAVRLAWQIASQHIKRSKPADVEGALKAGMIGVKDLVVGQRYYGNCRNASVATYLGEGVFVYKRYKFGSTFDEEIFHPEFDDGFDLFVPVAKVTD